MNLTSESYTLPTEHSNPVNIGTLKAKAFSTNESKKNDSIVFTPKELEAIKARHYNEGYSAGNRDGIKEQSAKYSENDKSQRNDLSNQIQMAQNLVATLVKNSEFGYKETENTLLNILMNVLFDVLEDSLANRELITSLLNKSLIDVNKMSHIEIATAIGTKKEITEFLKTNNYRSIEVVETKNLNVGDLELKVDDKLIAVDFEKYLTDFVISLKNTYSRNEA